ncbi:MAG: phosphonopyruvate decarboxylase [Planctomycetota bacterium]|jgi:phosphonopyruvate decarboxylase
MIGARDWFAEANARGFDFLTGVPCSFLTPFINYAIGASSYVGAASEGEAAGIAAGAWLGGRKPIAMCQNSGLGNLVNPLTSLQYTFRIPTLLVVTWRGQPGVKDEPQHELMGRATERILDAIEVPHELFPQETGQIAASLDRADAAMNASGLPFAFVMRKGSVARHDLEAPVAAARPAAHVERRPDTGWARNDALARVVEVFGPDCAYLASTGKLGRELFTLGDGPNRFYHVGAMGCVSGVGLGVALCKPDRRVVVLDGDGSLLMKMGALATIGHYAPENLVHIVFDNERHESTGGQSTVSSTVDFAGVAAAAGYRNAFAGDALEEARDRPGPTLVHLKVGVATDPDLGRPTIAPSEVARRFRSWLA